MIAPGRKIGRYQLREPLGSGGMSAVYRAYDPVIDRELAVKILPPDLARDPVLRRRFREEALALARLEHPNLVRIYAVGEEADLAYYAMELIAGRSLANVIEARGPFTLAEALAVMGQVLDALESVHDAGIVHRDIKPGNIMLDAGGRAVLMDFGLARRVERPTITAVGAILGTPEYMSPEQARGEPADQRSDLYACGIVLFEMLTGRPPFSGKDTIAILRQHAEKAPPELSELAPALPAGLDPILRRLLAKDPGERYPHVRDVAAALAPWASEGAKPDGTIQELLASVARLSTRDTRTAVSPPGGEGGGHSPGEAVEVAAANWTRLYVAGFAAFVAALALFAVGVALFRSRRAEPPALREPAPPVATPASGAPVLWRVRLRDGREFEAALVATPPLPGGRLAWTWRTADGVERTVPSADVLRFELKQEGERP